MQRVLAAVANDARLRNAEERCSVLRELVRSSPLLPHDAYPPQLAEACKDYPLTASR
jgi:hypothetical protein